MALFTSQYGNKKSYSIAEYAVFIIVIGILFAAIIPIVIRMNSYKRNAQRITDVKKIAQITKNYYDNKGEYPETLRDLEKSGVGEIPKDPIKKAYCTGTPGYQTGDYQYFSCINCEAIGPQKTYVMENIVQIGALMEWENQRGERNSGNRWVKYQIGEKSDCAANAVWAAGTLIEGVRGNRLGGTGSSVTNFITNPIQKDYDPWYNIIISSERK